MINLRIISEVIGSPEGHVNKTIDLLLERIKERKELKLLKETKFEAKKMENSQLFSGFIEYEIEFQNIESIVGFCFDFMPSSIEVMEPLALSMSAAATGDLFNELLARLHQNDLFLRNMIAELKMLKQKSA